jgi:hypothetical protein
MAGNHKTIIRGKQKHHLPYSLNMIHLKQEKRFIKTNYFGAIANFHITL